MTTFGRFVALGILAGISFVVWLVFSPRFATMPLPQSETTPEIISAIPNATYSNSQLGFSLTYPSTATSSPVQYDGFLLLTQTPVASFVLPRTMFEGTNLAEAGVYIGATSSPAIVATCATSSQAQGEVATSSVTINGTTFSVFTSIGVGAGNYYETKAYRTLQSGECIELIELLHSGNIYNYPPGAVTEFDHARFSGILEAIVHTYRAGR